MESVRPSVNAGSATGSDPVLARSQIAGTVGTDGNRPPHLGGRAAAGGRPALHDGAGGRWWTSWRRPPGPSTIQEILARDKALAQSSAYRNLVILEQTGVVHRVVSTDEFARYELAEHLTDHHHHHLICSQCGQVADFTVAPEVEEALARALGQAADGRRVRGPRPPPRPHRPVPTLCLGRAPVGHPPLGRYPPGHVEADQQATPARPSQEGEPRPQAQRRSQALVRRSRAAHPAQFGW